MPETVTRGMKVLFSFIENVTVSVACQLYRIEKCLADKPLGMFMREVLDWVH